MRGATQCARRLKQLVRSLRAKLGKVGRPPAGDAVTQMILGIFSRDVPESKAREALDRLRALVVDYNELRVVPPIEMSELVGALPQARMKCEDLSRALNKIFSHEHEVSLDRLSGAPRKEVVEYLDSIDGLDAYSRARVRLLGLQRHAVPLDEAMWAYSRREQIVDRKCPLEEAQAFLERRIPEGEALEFVALLEKQAWAEMGAAVRSGEVERISSIPPDRTARNMLQLVASGRETVPPASSDNTAAAREAGPRVVVARATAGSRAAKPVKKPTAKAAKKRPMARAAARSKAQAAVQRKAKAKRRMRTKPKVKPALRRKTKAKRTVRANIAKRVRRSSVKAKSA
jgi:hypothetical protein